MMPKQLTEKEMRDHILATEKQKAWDSICPPMSRAERRSAKGKMLIAQAEAAALRAEIEFLRQEQKGKQP